MTEPELPIRAGTPQDWDAVSRLLCTAFHVSSDSGALEPERTVYEPERALVVAGGDRVFAHAGAHSRELTVPGGVVAAAHVCLVAVEPMSRRRGLLTRMMQRQLRETYAAGRESVAVLWSSDARLYQRFGYGLAARRLQLEVDGRDVRLPAAAGADAGPGGTAAGRLRGGVPATLQPEIQAVYERLRPERPGWSHRDARWWSYLLADPPARRLGSTELQAVVHYSGSEPDGYALWRTRNGASEAGTSRGEVWLVELAATSPAGYLALWRFLLGLDLTRTTRFAFGCPDEPLLYLVDRPQELRPRLVDALWARLVDLSAALSARRYATSVDVVLEVSDAQLAENTGRWHLKGDGTTAACERTTAPADLACDIADLAAVYLGGGWLTTLAAAGRVRELRRGSLAAASTAFGWHRPPGVIEMF